jgi:Family of unknown function (DUF6869)
MEHYNFDELNYSFDKLVDTLIEYYSYEPKSKEAEDRFWAFENALNFKFDNNPEGLWRLILEVLKKVPSPLDKGELARPLGRLAAGPLDDLFTDYGPLFIDRIEKEAAVNPKFKNLLGGVWKGDIDDEIWRRKEKAQQY